MLGFLPMVLVSALAAAVALLALVSVRRLNSFLSPQQNILDLGALDAPRRYNFRNAIALDMPDAGPEADPRADDAFLGRNPDASRSWVLLLDALSALKPGIAQDMETLRRTGQSFHATAENGVDTLAIDGIAQGDRVTITVANAMTQGSQAIVDLAAQEKLQTDLGLLRATLDHSPIAAWRENTEGQVTWANANYLSIVESQSENTADVQWPLPRVFHDQMQKPPAKGQIQRVSIVPKNRLGAPKRFEVSAIPMDGDMLFLANPADRLMQAEEALTEFVQTLSKTFADLPIGLAIFDRRRELVLFNPALVTLSTLDVQMLSSRPTLYNFLDQLRENRHMPEPKNYKAWRESILKLETDAQDGNYHDLWTLPTGQTYRVIGRPHPDGAIAFMFEDITSEVSLTRQFRADLDLYQAVFDQRHEAMAVFSSEAQLVLSNAAYAEMFGHDPREMLGPMALREATDRWEQAISPGPIWREIREFGVQRPGRAGWTGRHTLPGDEGVLEVQISPLKAGSTLLSFRHLPKVAEPPEGAMDEQRQKPVTH
ncbi:MAG: PAS-domain containing protein [Pseudomonadota bacterium]